MTWDMPLPLLDKMRQGMDFFALRWTSARAQSPLQWTSSALRVAMAVGLSVGWSFSPLLGGHWAGKDHRK